MLCSLAAAASTLQATATASSPASSSINATIGSELSLELEPADLVPCGVQVRVISTMPRWTLTVQGQQPGSWVGLKPGQRSSSEVVTGTLVGRLRFSLSDPIRSYSFSLLVA